MRALPGLAALLLGIVACGDAGQTVSVELAFAPLEMADDASIVELSVVDTCPGDEMEHSVSSSYTWVLDRTGGGASPSLAPGRYALYGRAIDSSCRVIAAGCVPFQVKSEKNVRIPLELRQDSLGPTVQSVCGRGYSCEAACGDGDGGDMQGDGSEELDGAEMPMPPSCETTGTCDHTTWCDHKPTSVLLCDGFESSLRGWMQGEGAATVEVSSDNPFLGTYSAHGS